MRDSFEEKQVYPFWVIASIGIIFAMSPFAFAKTEKLDQDEYLWILFGASAFIFLLTLFVLIIRLKIKVDDQKIEIHFRPFLRSGKTLKWDELKKVEVRKSKSIREFGGWGYRIGRNKKAYTLYGNWGIELTFPNEKKLFIGTQRHIELENFLNDVVYPVYPHLKPGD